MRDTAERRIELINYISDVRITTLIHLAERFEVSTKTIRRDLDAMAAVSDIEISQGHDGGVKAAPGWYSSYRYLTEKQAELLHRILLSLSDEDQDTMSSILRSFEKPR